MKFPHITKAQVLAIVAFIIGQAVAYGWLTTEKSQLVLSAATALVTAAWTIADAFIQSAHVQAKAALVINGKDPALLSR